MKRLFTLIAMICLSLQMATAAQAEWVVERVSSTVWASLNGSGWRDVQVGEAFSTSTWIQTGERGQVIFARGSERIVYRPNTIATLESQGGGTRVGPIRGSVLLSIDPAKRERTIVETPHLAAVVLGTVLEVSMSPAASTVRVDEGRVEVRTRSNRVVVGSGQEATVRANALSTIELDGAVVTSLGQRGSRSSVQTGTPTPITTTTEDLTDVTDDSDNGYVDDSGNNRNGNGTEGNGSGNNGNGNGTNGNGSGNNGNGNGTNGDDDDDDD